MESIPIEGLFISVGDLKDRLIERKGLMRGDRQLASLILYNHRTKEEYLDDSTLIPRHTAVMIRRVPVYTTFPIIARPPPVKPVEPEVVEIDPEDLEWDDFVNVINGKSETLASQSRAVLAPPPTESSALVQTRAAALDWRRQGGGGFGLMKPPPGYVCHRCRVAGHFIQHCPTNGDPGFDMKRTVAVPRPNEAAFEEAMQGMPSSTSSAGQLQPELYCRLCRQVMKDAVFTSGCCFDTFCDRCIRGHLMSKCSCVCGATNVLADHLIPNQTMRNIISSMLDSSSGESGKQQVVDSASVKESASQESAPLPDEEDVQRKPVSDKLAGKRKAHVPMPVAAQNYAVGAYNPHPVAAQNYAGAYNPHPVAAQNYTGAYNPHRGGMDAYMPPYNPGFGHGFVPYWAAYGDQQGMMHSGAESSEARKAAGKRKRDAESHGSGDASSSKRFVHHRSSDRF